MTLFIFDKDGTICRSKSGQKFINSVADQELIPGVAEKCAELRAQGHTLAIASNQGGMAFKFMSFEDACDIVKHAAELINADFWADFWRFCPHHPMASGPLGVICDCRKPQPGLLKGIMDSLGFTAEDTIFIGDMEIDRQAAETAGVKFIWAWDFFGNTTGFWNNQIAEYSDWR